VGEDCLARLDGLDPVKDVELVLNSNSSSSMPIRLPKEAVYSMDHGYYDQREQAGEVRIDCLQGLRRV
jgi:hypothetical protein